MHNAAFLMVNAATGKAKEGWGETSLMCNSAPEARTQNLTYMYHYKVLFNIYIVPQMDPAPHSVPEK